MDEQCKTCRFWFNYDPGTVDNPPEFGYCRRYPPIIDPAMCLTDHSDTQGVAFAATRFPVTYFEEWCGEWQSKKNT